MDLKYFFILGGTDNEMEEIKEILSVRKILYVQPQPDWGDIVISKTQIPPEHHSRVIVFVECRPQTNPDQKFILIDHHGKLSHRPSSLIQVCKLLRIKPTLRQKLVGSIDSVFLKDTIRKYPRNKKQIIKIWEEGYQKKFSSQEEWLEFKNYCQKLWKQAKERYQIAKKTAVVWHAPASKTLLGALANLEGWSCLLVSGSPTTPVPVPIFFQGDKRVIRFLSQLDLENAYYGRGYFGCRGKGREIIKIIDSVLQPKQNPKNI